MDRGYAAYLRVTQIVGTHFWLVCRKDEVITIFYCEHGIEYVEQMFRSIFVECPEREPIQPN